MKPGQGIIDNEELEHIIGTDFWMKPPQSFVVINAGGIWTSSTGYGAVGLGQ